jgi:predicted O-methyltransferase YrrM
MSSILRPEVWNRVLAKYKGQPCNALEIGSYEGASAVWFAQNILTHSDAWLMCVDPWEDVEPYFGRGVRMETVRQTFLENTKHFPRVRSNRAPSNVIRSSYAEYDWIYIDGSHYAPDVLRDAVLSWQLLKINGVLLFDDYEYAGPWGKPKIAIDAFLTCLEGHYTLLEKGYQVAIERIS